MVRVFEIGKRDHFGSPGTGNKRPISGGLNRTNKGSHTPWGSRVLKKISTPSQRKQTKGKIIYEGGKLDGGGVGGKSSAAKLDKKKDPGELRSSTRPRKEDITERGGGVIW